MIQGTATDNTYQLPHHQDQPTTYTNIHTYSIHIKYILYIHITMLYQISSYTKTAMCYILNSSIFDNFQHHKDMESYGLLLHQTCNHMPALHL